MNQILIEVYKDKFGKPNDKLKNNKKADKYNRFLFQKLLTKDKYALKCLPTNCFRINMLSLQMVSLEQQIYLCYTNNARKYLKKLNNFKLRLKLSELRNSIIQKSSRNYHPLKFSQINKNREREIFKIINPRKSKIQRQKQKLLRFPLKFILRSILPIALNNRKAIDNRIVNLQIMYFIVQFLKLQLFDKLLMGHDHQHKDSPGPFTEQQQGLIDIADKAGPFLGHHHHHHQHHVHVEYKAPKEINTNLGLFALKKINIMNPSFLSVKQARLLEPVAPGTISFLTDCSFKFAGFLYMGYVWRTLGWKGYGSRAIIPLVAIVGAHRATMWGVNYIRQLNYSQKRKDLVEKIQEGYGKQFLLNALNPSFRF